MPPPRRIEDLSEQAIAAVARRREIYSVELAHDLGIGIGRAASVLRKLEAAGILRSRLADSPRSGIGRRYFRLVARPQ